MSLDVSLSSGPAKKYYRETRAILKGRGLADSEIVDFLEEGLDTNMATLEVSEILADRGDAELSAAELRFLRLISCSWTGGEAIVEVGCWKAKKFMLDLAISPKTARVLSKQLGEVSIGDMAERVYKPTPRFRARREFVNYVGAWKKAIDHAATKAHWLFFKIWA